MSRSHVSALAATAVMLATALAGGWAASTLDQPGPTPVAGTPVDVGFTVRQHGVTPLDMDGVAIEVGSKGTTGAVRFPARRDGTPGHYVASVTFPAAGSASWRVVQGAFPAQELPAVRVTAAPPAAATTGGGPGAPWAWVVAGIALAGAAAVAATRRVSTAPNRVG